jgi:hypothetical protein
MSQARDRRKRAARKRGGAGHRGDAKLDIRRRVRAVLKHLQLLAAFEAMPAYVRDQFFDCCHPDPKLAFDASFPTAEAFGGAYAELHEEVREGFHHAAIELNSFYLPVRDLLAIVIPIEAMVRKTLSSLASPLQDRPRLPAILRSFLEKAAGPLAHLARQEVVDRMFTALHEEVVVPLVSRSRLDGSLLHAQVSKAGDSRRQRVTMTLYAEKPATKYVRLHNAVSGGSRPTHRVGTSNTWNGIEWASWSKSALKGHWAGAVGIAADAQWPVYVQSHALKQLRSRLDMYAYADWAEHWMYESLKSPKIVSRLPGGDLLVAFEVMEKRLGYLVVTAQDGWVAVRTFLFLTMAQTPEGRLLERRLKLTRDEISYLRLHELSRFTQTDLKDDPQLRALLSECGCGHLFEMAEDGFSMMPTAKSMTPFAAELKQYVGMAA